MTASEVTFDLRSFAEERHSRTDQLLLTSPVSVGGIVLGKYFALCVIFALPCLVDAGMILVLKVLGATGTSTLANFSALLCYYLMGCAAIAIGVFLSSLTENQIIAAVSCLESSSTGPTFAHQSVITIPSKPHSFRRMVVRRS